MISFIIPTRNNLPYLKLAHGSIRKFYPEYEIIILDDNSTDGTQEWADTVRDDHTVYYKHDGRQIGHTVLYDKGVELASNDIFTIFHADMVCGPNYVENILKWLKRGGVVAATRIEPPLHPPGKEKIVKDFGTYTQDFKQEEFFAFCLSEQAKVENKDIITRGIFAPWAMYKDDFLAIGGHDKLFCPFPYEDSDIFQRMILAHYEINQSRDSFVYHFTCRGHRWTEKVQKDDLFYKLCCSKNTVHFIRKWGMWIENDENCYPIINKKYDIGFVAKNSDNNLMGMLEPWCSTLYTDGNIDAFIHQIQPGTPFDLKKRVKRMSEPKTNEILVYFDAKKLDKDKFDIIINLPKIITESGEIGVMEHDIFRLEIKGMSTFEEQFVNNNSEYYQKQLRPLPAKDAYCTDTLFQVYENVKKNV